MKINHYKDWTTGPYQEVRVREGTATISSGLLDKDESRELARDLRDVADCLDPRTGGINMTESTDQEFTDGLSPRVVHHDPRLPSQHTLDARQLRLLHRAIDTLAFTAEQYRATLPRGVAELIDATTSAWQPLMSELIEQQDRFQRGD